MTHQPIKATLNALALSCTCAIFASACSGGGSGSTFPSQGSATTLGSGTSTNPVAPLNPGAVPSPATGSAAGIPIASPPGIALVSQSSQRLDAARVAPIPAGGTLAYSDTFERDALGHTPAGWSATSGSWAVCQVPSSSHELCATSNAGDEATIGGAAWANYHVDAIAVDPFVQGGAAVLGRMQDATHFYQLELRRDVAGSTTPMWYIWKYDGRSWTEIAGGIFTTHSNPYYRLRMAFNGNVISAFVAYDYSTNFQALGSGTDGSYRAGTIGLRSWGTAAVRFDDVAVTLDNAALTPAPTPTPTQVAISPPGAPSASVQTIEGCPVYTAGDWYNRDVTNASTDSHSADYIASVIAAGDNTGFYVSTGLQHLNLATPGTPKVVVHQKVSYHAFPNPFPFAPGYLFEGTPATTTGSAGDSDVLILLVNPPACHIYEAYSASYSNGLLSAYSGRDDDLSKPMPILPNRVPGSSASGTPHIPGMVKYEEVASGHINHVLNVSAWANSLCRCWTKPASDSDGVPYQGPSTPYQLPYGAHLRLKATFDDSHFGPQSRVIAEALKHYGAFVTDTGSRYNNNNAIPAIDPIHGGSWNRSDLGDISSIKYSDFDVLTVGPVSN